MGNTTAVVLLTFARPDYLKQCLGSLEKCIDKEKFDWVVFQDNLNGFPLDKPGYKKLSPLDIELNIDILNSSSINWKEKVINQNNKGINFQINQAFNLFEVYDKLFIFEDDLVVSKYYLRLLDKFSNQHPDKVASFHSLVRTDFKPQKDLHKMKKATRPRLWGFVITKEGWNKIKKVWEKRYIPEQRSPYYDVIITQAIKKFTGGKWQPLIPRAFNVGLDGILSTNKSNWSKRGLNKQATEIEYKGDEKLNSFMLLP